jgi:hypothetical protein
VVYGGVSFQPDLTEHFSLQGPGLISGQADPGYPLGFAPNPGRVGLTEQGLSVKPLELRIAHVCFCRFVVQCTASSRRRPIHRWLIPDHNQVINEDSCLTL